MKCPLCVQPVHDGPCNTPVLRCWQCGVEPLDIYEVTTFGDPEPRYLPGRWPPGDHPHAVDPPTPAELAAGGDAALARIVEDWSR